MRFRSPRRTTSARDTALSDAAPQESWVYPEQPGVSTRMVLAGMAVCLVVAGSLSSARLLTMAERQEFGGSRENWVKAAEGLDEAASSIGLDRPAGAIEGILYEESGDRVVLGELAEGTSDRASDGSPGPLTRDTTASTVVPATSTTLANAPSTLQATTTLPATTTTTGPPPTAPPLRVITADEPIRIWAGGDSLGEYVGSRLQYKIADPTMSRFTLDYHISTGIARPDYFDWPATLSNAMLADDDLGTRPEAVIYMVGGNDDQPMQANGQKLTTNSPEWLDEYRIRVGLMMDITAYTGVRFYWVGLPPMRDERREAIAVNVNAILADEAKKRDWVTLVDIVPLLLNSEGLYDQYIIGPDGERHKAREGDGVHITAVASQWISESIWMLIQDDWGFAAGP